MRWLLMFALACGLSACGGNPCDELRERLCEAGGPAVCAELDKGGPMASDGQKRACTAVLSDEVTFAKQLEALTRGR